MVEISLSGSGEGPGWVTAPGYSTAGKSITSDNQQFWQMDRRGGKCPRNYRVPLC